MWTITADSDSLLLTREGVTLRLPATPQAIYLLHQILRSDTERAKIASPGFPTQTQLNEIIKQWTKPGNPGDRGPQAPTANLKELGL